MFVHNINTVGYQLCVNRSDNLSLLDLFCRSLIENLELEQHEILLEFSKQFIKGSASETVEILFILNRHRHGKHFSLWKKCNECISDLFILSFCTPYKIRQFQFKVLIFSYLLIFISLVFQTVVEISHY